MLYWDDIIRSSVILLVTILSIYITWKWRKFFNLVGKLPSWKLRFYHFLGHAHFAVYSRLMNTALSSHIYDFIILNGTCHVFRNEGLVMLWAILHPMIVVFKAETVEVILNNSTELEKAWIYKFTHPWLGDGLLNSHGTKWKNRRKLLTPAFHFNILKDFLPVFNTQANIFADILNKRATDEFVDIVPLVTRCSLDVICESILGVKMHAQTKLNSPYVKSVNFLTNAISERMFNPLIWNNFLFKISPLGRKFAQHTKLVHNFTLNLINEKKAKMMSNPKLTTAVENGGDCFTKKRRALLDLLLDEHMNNNALSESDIVEEVDTFTFEGHDTTAMAMSWALYLIGLHAGVQDKIHQELDSLFGNEERDATMDDLKDMKYLECVFKIKMMFHCVRIWMKGRLVKLKMNSIPPVTVRYRDGGIAGESNLALVKAKGRMVPKGSSCMVFSYLLHRDPEHFPIPEKFDPDRFSPEKCAGRHPFAYVPFSAGPRNCIGQRFAFMEEKVVVSTILRKFRIRSLDPRDKVHAIDDVVLRPVNGLRLEIRPRRHVPKIAPLYYHYP